ncbi:MAG: bepE 3, partial [Firmicutes bacterium]|nr:bepE 3 [Bacillota bacterium]
MKSEGGFNLSEWALNHRSLMIFIMVLVFVSGAYSYTRLGREEDPGFIIRTMVVTTQWPGASAKEVEQQVTDKIEKKIQEVPGLFYIKSYSQPGRSNVFVYLRDEVKAKDVWPTWVKVRNLVNDMATTLPQGVQGPFFNDTFGDVYGSIYALTGDGFSMGQMELQADSIRLLLRNVPQVSKVGLIGVQPQKIHIEVENSKLATLGLNPGNVISTLQKQNAMNASGRIETSNDNIYLRITGLFSTVENISNIAIQQGDRIFRLGDIATVTRGYPDPPQPEFYYNGKPSIAVTVAMEGGGNVMELGKGLEAAIERISREMPAGMEIHQVSDQPKVVEESIGEFSQSLEEAVIIVLVVSFLSLGLRAGLVVLVSMPLVLCTVFLVMDAMGITLQKISLGALIIALGLLVDDAMICVEMMEYKLEQGWDKVRAAEFAYTATAFPML